MNMTNSVQTKVIWEFTNLALPNDQYKIDQKRDELISAGKEASVVVYENTVDQIVVIRSWIDLETAEEWVNFVSTFNPVSAVVLNNEY
jgi:hypothetical protein